MNDAELQPWLHHNETPPQDWLRHVAAELLLTKVTTEWLAAEWDSAVQDCTVPLVKTTGQLRTRLEKHPDAFYSTMLRLGSRIAAALTDKIDFEWNDFSQTLCERAEFELSRCCSPPAADEHANSSVAAMAATTSTSAPATAAAAAGDPVFQRARQAQEITLRRAGQKFIDKLGKAKYSGERGLDGFLLCDKWAIELKWDGRSGRNYTADASPRGPQAYRSASIDEDEYSSSGEGRSLAEAAGVPIWAITRRRKQARSATAAIADAAEVAKLKHACGAKKRLQQTLGCEIVYRCLLCQHPMRAARQVSSLVDHRNGKFSCVRAIAKYKSTNGGGRQGPPCPGSVAAIDAQIEAALPTETCAALHVSRAAAALAAGYRNLYDRAH